MTLLGSDSTKEDEGMTSGLPTQYYLLVTSADSVRRMIGRIRWPLRHRPGPRRESFRLGATGKEEPATITIVKKEDSKPQTEVSTR
jgi:hypothetical protein